MFVVDHKEFKQTYGSKKEAMRYRLWCIENDARIVTDTVTNDGIEYDNVEILELAMRRYKEVVNTPE